MKTIVAFLCVLLAFNAYSGPHSKDRENGYRVGLNETHELFLSGNYEEALDDYMSFAEVGSVEAFYQLGSMYESGKGTTRDPIQAFAWLNLARQDNYRNSGVIADELFNSFSKNEKALAHQKAQRYLSQYGKVALREKFYPKLLPTDEKVSFPEKEVANYAYVGMEDEGETYPDALYETEFFQPSVFQPSVTGGMVVDYEIYPDGSRRDLTMVYLSTHAATLSARDIKFKKSPPPTFKGEGTHFLGRAYWGLSTASESFLEKYQRYFYFRISKEFREIREGQTAAHKYSQALMMMSHRWLETEKGEAVRLLTEAATAGIAEAQYLLGTVLYREQKRLPEAIGWIEKSAAQGYATAEYRLGRLMLASPFIEKDEEKALFWLRKAALRGMPLAIKKAASLELFAESESLINTKEAMEFIQKIDYYYHNDPEITFMKGLANLKKKPRNFRRGTSLLLDGIEEAKEYGWDVTEWEKIYDSYTQQNVWVIDVPSGS